MFGLSKLLGWGKGEVEPRHPALPEEVLSTLMVGSAPVAIIQTDLSGNCLFVNERWCQFTGIGLDRAAGQGWVLAIHPDDRPDFFAAWSHAVSVRAPFVIEHRLVADSGHAIWVQANMVPHDGPDGMAAGFVGTVIDISSGRRAEQALRDSEARLRAIFDTVVDGIVIIDRDGIIRSFNPAAARIFGWSAEEVVGMSIGTLMPEPFRSSHQAQLERVVAGGPPRVYGKERELLGLRKDGSQFPLEVALSEFRTGAKLMFTGVVRDISERKQIDRMKDEFISVVSHELRTPLTSINGALSLIEGGLDGELPEKTRTLVELARKGCGRLTAQLNDILDMETLWSGRASFQSAPVDLADIAVRAVEVARVEFPDTRFEFQDGLRPGRAVLLGDPDRLVQVVSKLLSNAARYSPPEAAVEIGLGHKGRWWRLSVTDHGAGVPGDFRARVFQRFAQADGGADRSSQGVGLGLAIAQAIVSRHGGHIGFDSEENRGSTFWFELPEEAGLSSRPVQERRSHPRHESRVETGRGQSWQDGRLYSRATR